MSGPNSRFGMIFADIRSGSASGGGGGPHDGQRDSKRHCSGDTRGSDRLYWRIWREAAERRRNSPDLRPRGRRYQQRHRHQLRLLRRRYSSKGGRPFLGARPAPKTLAGYNPAPREPGRGPEGEPYSVPLTPSPAFPPSPSDWLPPFIPPFEIPGIVVPPTVPPSPPCNPKTDPACPPPPPPDDVPEPAGFWIAIVGIVCASIFFGRPRRRRPI